MKPRALKPSPPPQAAQYYIPQPNLGAQRPRRIITGLSVNDVRLNKAENAWKPGRKRESLPLDPEAKGTQDLFKKVQSVLNKVTPENFNQLIKQVMDLTINTEERLKGVVDLVFDKAIDEPSFSVTYANMCRCLAELKVPTTDDPNVTVSFIKLLRSGCKTEFDKHKEDDVVFNKKKMELDSAASTDRDRLQVELQEAEGISRRRSVGNIKFIGELYKLKMLNTANIQYCVGKMMEHHNEKSLECLCTLLTTIGRSFDSVAKPQMDQYIEQMKTIITEQKTSTRIRFLLQDTVELRLHNWVSRKPDQGPKTIEQIHREAQSEEQEVQRKVEQQLSTKKQPGQACSVQTEGPWKSVSTWNTSRTTGPIKSPTFSKAVNLGARGPPPWKSVNNDVQLHKSENAWKPCRNRASEHKPEPESTKDLEPVKPEPVVEESSSPGQPEAQEERTEAQPTPPTPSEELLVSALVTQSERLWSPGELTQHMERILLDDMASDQQTFNCVKEKVDKSQTSSSPYLRELMTALSQAAEKENTNSSVHTALFQKRSPVALKKNRYSEREREIHALNELQTLILALDEPPNLLRIFFDCLCDEDVISEEAFSKYGTRKDPAHQLGKGVALKTVTAFFTWLREAESEEELTTAPDASDAVVTDPAVNVEATVYHNGTQQTLHNSKKVPPEH